MVKKSCGYILKEIALVLAKQEKMVRINQDKAKEYSDLKIKKEKTG